MKKPAKKAENNKSKLPVKSKKTAAKKKPVVKPTAKPSDSKKQKKTEQPQPKKSHKKKVEISNEELENPLIESSEKKEPTQCTAICLDGKRCSRMAIDETGKCKQHHQIRKGKVKQYNPKGLSSYVMNLKYRKKYIVSYKCKVTVSGIYDILRNIYGYKITYQSILNKLFEGAKMRFRLGRLPFEAPLEGKGTKKSVNALELQGLATAEMMKFKKEIDAYKGDKRKKAFIELRKKYEDAVNYFRTATNLLNKNKPLSKTEKINNFIRSYLDFRDFKYSMGNGCQTNLENAYDADNEINILICPYSDTNWLMPYANAIELTDLQLNMFWEAKDEYLATYYPQEHRFGKNPPTMFFEIYNGIERTTNIFHINFNKWNITNADKEDFKKHYLDTIYYEYFFGGKFEYGGEIDE